MASISNHRRRSFPLSREKEASRRLLGAAVRAAAQASLIAALVAGGGLGGSVRQAWGQNVPAVPGTPAGGGAGGRATPGAPAANPEPSVLEGLPVLRVDVVGNTRTDARVILAPVRTQAGQPFSRALVDVDVQTIAALDLFAEVSATYTPQADQTGRFTGVVVQFVVVERPFATAVEITGNRKFTTAELRDGLLMKPGVSIDPFRIESDRKTILDQYRRKGYASASVGVNAEELKRNIVHYEVVEGPTAVVDAIRFEGNHALTPAYIKWRIQTKSHLWILRKGLLDMEKLQGDLVTIRELYRKRGYIDARVSYNLEYSEDKSRLTVRFIIIEGPRYRIGKMIITGNKVFADFELLGDTTRFGPGSFAEQDKIDTLRKRIEDAYGHEGYINRNVEITPSYTTQEGVVDLNITVTEGLAYLVGSVRVRGNANIQDRVIRRQIRIYPDQTFDMVQVRKSIERLKAARIFSDVKITPITSPGNPANVQDALVEVQEGQTGKFMIGAGVSTNSGLVGQISIEQQNFDIANPPHSWGELFRGQAFKGAGQYFQILLEPGTEFQRYRVSFQEPYLLDSPYSFGNDLYYFTRQRESWDERRIGDIVTLGRRFGDVWGLSLAVRAEQVGITNPQDVFKDRVSESHVLLPKSGGGFQVFNDTAQEILDEQGDHFLTSIKPAVVRDTTDSRSFPTTGTRTSFSLEQYGAVGGDVTITKLVLGFDWYKTVYTDLFDRKTVFSLRNQVGLIPFGTSPFYERFYLGGIGDLRGFKFRGVSPRSGPLKDPVGGDFSWATTAELNYPIYENVLRGVVFLDIGTVERDITLDSIRSDVGVGVRITLPFFQGLPLALDFAYPTSKQDGDLTQIIAVSLGANF
jgi:outer membrane protein insertion porin family